MRGRLPWLRTVAVLLAIGCGGDDSGVEPGPTTGSLTVTVIGLPSGVSPSVTVTGPSGFSRTITASETLTALTPGSYTVTAATVNATEGRYAPAPATQTVTVAASTLAATVNVNYALATGGLTVSVRPPV